ncbi:ImmA/IrrE family metallo-endopeptidase [Tateyamaria sp.]|uniref:ImmA/IrrE family metallo-endopeptidase n=1 Tax=Tateyamaria sp. TaxID=1929288 RepID=UPI00329E643F
MPQSREWQKLDQAQKRLITNFHGIGEVPIGAIARELGLSIKVANLGPGISGQISSVDGNYVIKVNRFEAKERQRYTIAHEIAHFLLHRDVIDSSINGISDNVLYRSGAPEHIEFEANRLAADILMPTDKVKSKLAEFGGAISEAVIVEIANYFRVSKAAMEIRLGNLA